MKYLLSAFLCLVSTMAFGAVPSYTSFLGSNGITVISNPPTGPVIINGSGVSGTQTLRAGGTNISASATGQTFFVSKNLEQFYTNVNGQVSTLTRDKTNHAFYSSGGYQEQLGWFINDAGGAAAGTGTNFGWYDVTADTLLLYTWGDGLDLYFADDLFVPNMDGNGTVVVNTGLAAGGKLQTTNSLNISNLNTASIFTTNGIQTQWPDGYVFFSSNGWLAGESIFTYDRGDDILSVHEIHANYVLCKQVIYQMPTIAVVGANSNQFVWAGLTNTVELTISTNVTFTNFPPATITSGQSCTYLARMTVTNINFNPTVNWGLGTGYQVRIWTNNANAIWGTLTNTKTYLASWTFFGTNGHLRLSLEE